MQERQEPTTTGGPEEPEGAPIGLALLLLPLAVVGVHLLLPEIFVLELAAIVVVLLSGSFILGAAMVLANLLTDDIVNRFDFMLHRVSRDPIWVTQHGTDADPDEDRREGV